ncbi:MAG: HAD family hydrolase [Caldilineaceae bacterium]|nr:HAD family hydrolase [Caldilineaceae bacterium]
MSNSTPDDEIEIRPGMEPLTPEELEQFLARARAQGRTLTSEEQYAIFGPAPEKPAPQPLYEDVAEMDAALLTHSEVDALADRFFGEQDATLPAIPRLIQGVIFDFDYTLVQLTRPIDELMAEGARQADAYMRSTGMTLPDDFWHNIVEARRFAEEKSEEEQEEHIADDAMSFLLQFFGYPASKMDPAVLRRAVDIFYAPEMTAWQPVAGAVDLLRQLHTQGYKVALLANYNCDRVFQRMVDYAGFRPYLDIVLSSSSVERRKPDEIFFNLVLERWDALPHEVIVVGDSLVHDIKGGLDLGAFTVQVQGPTSVQIAYQNEQAAAQVRPDAVISELAQLPALVAQWAVA